MKDLIQEFNTTELNKRDLIKESKLNIKLSKFSGFDSELDVYTFQTEFEKLYLRTTTTLGSETFAARNFRGFAFFGLFRES